MLVLALLAIQAGAFAQEIENESFTYSGYFTFTDFSGTTHKLEYSGLNNTGGNNISLPGYDWQGDGTNQGPDFHVSCSATLVGSKANVNRSTQSDTPPLTFPPGNWSDGQEVTIIDFYIDRTGSGSGGDCRAEDFDYPEITIEKTVDNGTSATISAGGSFTYELVVTNTGTTTLEDVNVVDNLDLLGGALSVDSFSPGSPVCSLTGATLDCVYDQLAVGASETISITMQSGGTSEAYCGSVQNSADAEGFDPAVGILAQDFSNVVDVDIVDCQTIEPGQITIVKNTVGGDGSFGFSGDLGSFSIATSGGTGSEQFTQLSPGAYSVGETVPAGWDLTSIECVSDANSSTTIGSTSASIDLGSGGDVTCTFTNTLLNPAIEITKDDGGQTVGEGMSFAYGLDYANTGELDLSNVVISETVPANTTFNAAGSTAGWSCADNAGPGSVCQISIGNVVIGGSGSVNFGLTVDELWSPNPETGQCGQEPNNPLVDNTASIVGDSDNGQVDDSDSDTTPIDVACEDLNPGIEITKTDGGQIVGQEQSFAYSLSYANTGELDLSNVVISETVPANTTFNAAGSTAGWSCPDNAPAGTVCEFSVGNLPVDGSDSVSFGLTVDQIWGPDPETGLCGEEPQNPQVDNTASIVGDSGNGSVDDSDSDSTPISVSCDDLDAGLTVRKVVSSGDTSQVFQFSGSVSDDGFDSFSLSHQQSTTFQLPVGTYSVSESVPEGWELESSSCSNGDPVDSIELAAESTVICTFTNRQLEPGIEITKTDGGVIVAQESDFSYSLSYANNGELDLANVVITETVPVNTTFNAAGSTAGWSCADNAPAGTVCELGIGNLPVDGSGSVDFGLTVDQIWGPDPETGLCGERPENPRVDNTASIVGDYGNARGIAASQVSDEDSDFTPISVSCDDLDATLTIEKFVSAGDTEQSFQFNGSSSEQGFDSFSLADGESASFGLPLGTYSVSEVVPEGWELESTSCTGGNTIGNIELTEGVSVTCTFTNREQDPGPGITIRKSDNVESVGQGGNLLYTLEYANTGDVDLTDVTITETVPDDTAFNESGVGAGQWTCASGACTAEIGNLAVGASGQIAFPVTVDMLWEPDPETGQCPPKPENPQVNNVVDIIGSWAEGEVDDRDIEVTPVTVLCQDQGGEPEPRPTVPIPVNHPLGMLILIMLMIMVAGWNLQRRF